RIQDAGPAGERAGHSDPLGPLLRDPHGLRDRAQGVRDRQPRPGPAPGQRRWRVADAQDQRRQRRRGPHRLLHPARIEESGHLRPDQDAVAHLRRAGRAAKTVRGALPQAGEERGPGGKLHHRRRRGRHGADGARLSGVTVTQDVTSTGRYLLTFYRGFTKGPQAKMAIMEGPATGTAFPTTTGSEARFRSYASPTAAASLQLLRSDTQADADGANGTVVHFILVF